MICIKLLNFALCIIFYIKELFFVLCLFAISTVITNKLRAYHPVYRLSWPSIGMRVVVRAVRVCVRCFGGGTVTLACCCCGRRYRQHTIARFVCTQKINRFDSTYERVRVPNVWGALMCELGLFSCVDEIWSPAKMSESLIRNINTILSDPRDPSVLFSKSYIYFWRKSMSNICSRIMWCLRISALLRNDMIWPQINWKYYLDGVRWRVRTVALSSSVQARTIHISDVDMGAMRRNRCNCE